MRLDETGTVADAEVDAPTVLALGGTSYARVRDVIRRDIVRGAFSAGERLKAAELARRYGVSQVPVREALQQLQGEGLVVIEPNRGARVRRIDARFVENVYEIREVLGAHFARKVSPAAAPALARLLETANARFEAAVASGDLPAMQLANARFHDTHFRFAGNDEAADMLESQAAPTRVLRRSVGFSQGRLAAIRREHLALIRAFRRGESERAARIVILHTRASRGDLLARVGL